MSTPEAPQPPNNGLAAYGRRPGAAGPASVEEPLPLDEAPAPLRNRASQSQYTKLGVGLLVVVLAIAVAFLIGHSTGSGPKATLEIKGDGSAVSAAATQSGSSQDESAKSDARNLVTQVELCYTTAGDYSKCKTASELGGSDGLPIVDGPNPGAGKVAVVSATPSTYDVEAVSKSGARYQIAKSGTGFINSCSSSGTSGSACVNGTW